MADGFICGVCGNLFDMSDLRHRKWTQKNNIVIEQPCCKHCTIVPACKEKASGIHSEIWVASEDLIARDKTAFKGLDHIPLYQKGICSDCYEIHIWSTDKGRWLTEPELDYRVIF